MESSRRISDLDPHARAVVERVFGQPLPPSSDLVLVLRTSGACNMGKGAAVLAEVPSYFDVLEGMSDADLAEIDALTELPVTLANPPSAE